MNAPGPLQGKRIVVTRAIEQSRELVTRLENMGATVLLFPAVSFSEPSDTAELDRAIHSLGAFDWILFTSANAARFFSQRCRKLGVVPGQGGNYRCAAVGSATASAVASEGFPVDHVAQEFNGLALARELSTYIYGKKIVLPRSERARSDLPDALKTAGAEVTDVISFFSPSAIENMRAELGEEVLSRLGAKAAMAAVGPVTAAALRDAGLRVAIEAPLATAESMAAAIANYFSPIAGSQARAV
jgi:uroporphyrinogen-III synthase